MGMLQQEKVSSKTTELTPKETPHPTFLSSLWCLLQAESGLPGRALAGPRVSGGEQPAQSVHRSGLTASWTLQALPLPHRHPPRQTVPRVCLLRRHWGLGCAGWWRSQKTRRRCGMWSCLACASAGAAPLDGRPPLPRDKSWSGPQTGL